MKKYILHKINSIVLFSAIFIAFGCNDFLEKPPLTDFTDENYWSQESNVKAFAWGLYDQFYGYGRGGTLYGEFYWQQEGNQNYEMKYSEDLLNSTFISFPKGAYTANARWDAYYANVRKTNLMLERVPIVNMTDQAKNHWTGVAKFFRAYNFFQLVSAWGDIPMPLEYTSPSDLEKIYLPRSDRKVVIEQVIDDLKDAVSKLKDNDGVGAVNKYVAEALLARVALFEGTFRKYHKLDDYTKFLEVAVSASQSLLDSKKFILAPTFKEKYNSDDLNGNPEIILYKHYEKNVMTHTVQAYTHCSAPALHGLTKYAVESYVCTDGLPISQSPLYKGDKGIENVRANRDNRLLNSMFDKLGFYGVPYADIIVSSTGYVTSLYDNPLKDIKDNDVVSDGKNYIDAPVFTISEIYLILAEAKAELNTLTQDDLDNTINKLRERAGVKPLQLSGNNIMANGVVIEDPARTSLLESTTKGGIVSPVIWEIRRERRAELIGWLALRHLDIDRWAKGEYMSSKDNPDVMLGAWIGSVPAGSEVKINADGYIQAYPQYSRSFESTYYLDPIPLNNIILYESKGKVLTQNSGW